MNRIRKLFSLPGRYARFLRDWRQFRQRSEALGDRRFDQRWSDRMPALWENSATTAFDAHYVYHTAWAVRTVARLAPAKHVDISSTVYFCTTLSAIMPVEFYDFRPAPITLEGLTCLRADLTSLPFDSDSIPSLSCMHTIEHVGLGRYGDAIDPAGDLTAIRELKRVLAPAGHLLLVVPVGRRALRFNAHRIYDHDQVMALADGLELVGSALVTDDNAFLIGPAPSVFDQQSYGCGCFLFRKPEQSGVDGPGGRERGGSPADAGL